MNEVHGDSLDDAEKVTSTLSVLTRSPSTVTLNGRQAHRAYKVAVAVNGYEPPSAYVLPRLGERIQRQYSGIRCVLIGHRADPAIRVAMHVAGVIAFTM